MAERRIAVVLPRELGALVSVLEQKLRELDAALALLNSGKGSPETVVRAPVGAIYQRLDGGAATTLYVKESGTGNTGWVAK